MRDIDIYDFDKTVYPTDSTMQFWLFCLARYPYIIVYLPVQIIFLIMWVVKILPTGVFKSLFMRFVAIIPTEKAVKAFWNKNEKNIYEWFRKENRERYTVVISASPDYLLGEIANRLQVDKLICTKGDSKTGKLVGKNCKGEEKVKRLNSEMRDFNVVCVYSDSLKSDAPIFALGKKKIHTVAGKLISMEEN